MSTCPERWLFSVKAGDVVKAGDTLARLENHEMDLEIAELQGEFDSQTHHLLNLEREQGTRSGGRRRDSDGPQGAGRLKQRLSRRLEDRKRLTLRRSASRHRAAAARPIARHAARPIAHLVGNAAGAAQSRGLFANRHAVLPDRRSERLGGRRGDRSGGRRFRASRRSGLDQARRTAGRRLSSARWRPWRKSILQVAPRELADRGDLPSRVDAAGNGPSVWRPRIRRESRWTIARNRSAAAPPGRAKIDAASQSLGARLWRSLEGTFQFHW